MNLFGNSGGGGQSTYDMQQRKNMLEAERRRSIIDGIREINESVEEESPIQ